MRATVDIDRKTLVEMLEQARRALNARASLAVLTNFLLEARDGRLFVVATDLEMSVAAFRPAEVDGEAQALVPARPFLDFVKALPEKRVTLTFHEQKETRTIMAGPYGEEREEEIEVVHREVRVAAGATATAFSSPHDPEDFPLPDRIKGMRVVVDAETLQEAIRRVTFAASRDASRPVLQGVLLEPAGASLLMVATDGYRLAVQRVETLQDVPPTPQDWIVPAQGLADIEKMLRKQKYRGKVVVDAFFPSEEENIPSRTAIRWPGVSVALTNIEGSYPLWRRIVEDARTDVHVQVEAKALASALKGLKPALPKSNMIRVHVNGKLEMVTSSVDVGETRVVVPIVGTDGREYGEEYVIGVNWKYLTDVTKVLKSASLDIGLPPQGASPIVFSAGDAYRYLLMPMRER